VTSVFQHPQLFLVIFLPTVLFATASLAAEPRQSQRPAANEIEQLLKVQAPVVLCIDDEPALGGQPSGKAYAKAAASGYRSVLTLRSKKDGIDLLRERWMVEQHRLRYFNIPTVPNAPRRAQVDEFLALVRDPANHPMLINCGFAERAAPLMMIFRIIEQGWSEERALDEAVRTGLPREPLKQFARDYLAHRKSINK
jgi:protein tyrosine phosphatase (PTP) superfamily phosphohydrolase (DUF442 family)